MSAQQVLDLVSNPERMGQYLRHVREGMGMSRTAFAKHVGIDDSNVSRVERGLQRLSIEALQTIAVKLEGSVDVFIAKALAWSPSDNQTANAS